MLELTWLLYTLALVHSFNRDDLFLFLSHNPQVGQYRFLSEQKNEISYKLRENYISFVIYFLTINLTPLKFANEWRLITVIPPCHDCPNISFIKSVTA